MVETRRCLSEPIAAVFDVARFLDAAVSAHLAGNRQLAAELIKAAEISEVRDWVEALWGKGGPWSRPLFLDQTAPFIPKANRLAERMPSSLERKQLIERDGFHCRFCGVPLVRADVRTAIRAAYPDELPWGSTNTSQHSGFQALWLQFDHLIPHARGGSNAMENMLITCAPCNFGRSNLTLAEVGVADPRSRETVRSTWDGLERFLAPIAL